MIPYGTHRKRNRQIEVIHTWIWTSNSLVYAYLIYGIWLRQLIISKFILHAYLNKKSLKIPRGYNGYVPLVVSTAISFLIHDLLSTVFVTKVSRRVPLVEQEQLTFPVHMISPPLFSEVRDARSLVFCAVFCRSLFFLLCFLFRPLWCLSFDLLILIIPLVSSNSFY
jgi:hypothetical protein